MKFKRYLAAHKETAWEDNYIRYAELKKLLVRILEEGAPVYVPTALSLTVGRQPEEKATPQEQFFLLLEEDVQRINEFTQHVASGLRAQLREVLVGLSGGVPGSSPGALTPRGPLSSSGAAPPPQASSGGGTGCDLSDATTRKYWLAAARRLGEAYLQLEKYVNLNYTGLQKILKKHDKLIPTAPCWQFYKVHINRQPWVRGEHHDIQVTLSRIFSRLHSAAVSAAASAGGPSSGPPPTAGPSAAAIAAAAVESVGIGPGRGFDDAPVHHLDFRRNTYWARSEDVAEVKHLLMQHMAVLPPPTNASAGLAGSSAHSGAAALWAECDTAARDLVNTMYLDNPSLELYHNLLYGRPQSCTLCLRWYGSHMPETVDIIRQVHQEGWRPEDCTEDSFPIQETRVADFLNGRWTWADARELMMPSAADAHRRHRRHKQQQQQHDLHHRRHHHTHTHSHNHQHHQQAADHAGRRSPGPPAPGSSQRAPESGASSGGGGAGSHGHGGKSRAAEDPLRLAQEYQLFKTFTEVARLVESKGLQPMVQVRLRQTTFRDPRDDQGLHAVLEEDVQMLLEYAYDTTTRLSHGLWRQEHPADAIEFPYAIFKLHRQMAGPEEAAPAWLLQLLASGLLRPMDDFSKFLHACAGLLPDMVRAVPQWIDDAAVQKSLYANVVANEDLQALLLAGHNVVAELEEGLLEGRPSEAAAAASVSRPEGPSRSATSVKRQQSLPLQPAGSAASNSSQATRRSASERHAAAGAASDAGALTAAGSTAEGISGVGGGADGDGAAPPVHADGSFESPVTPLLHKAQRYTSSRLKDAAAAGLGMGTGSGSMVAAAGAAAAGSAEAGPGSAVGSVTGGPATARVQAGWQAKLLQRQAFQGRAYQPQLIFLDPSQFLRNERIFLMWLRTAITVGGIATGMLGFAASARTDPYERPTIHISEITAFVLMLMAIAMASYGISAFVWRSTRFYELHPTRFDDTTGALAMTAMVAMALSGLMICNIADLMEVLGDGEGPPPQQPGNGTAADASLGVAAWAGLALGGAGEGQGGAGQGTGQGVAWLLGRGGGAGWRLW